MRIFDGMQPQFKQVPPIGPGSINATLRFLLDAAAATFSPEPAPMTMRSNFCMDEGKKKCIKIYLFGAIVFSHLLILIGSCISFSGCSVIMCNHLSCLNSERKTFI